MPRGYLRDEPGDPVELFAERVGEYCATVVRAAAANVAAVVAVRCAERGVQRLVAPADIPPAWRPAGIAVVPDSDLDVGALDAVDGALTGCALAIAATGTIVLDGGSRQGTRRVTLVPDYHVCVVEADQIVGGVPEAMRAIAAAARAGRPVTLVSGPSATADIELARVEGVHGPRTLDVVLVDA